MRWRAEPEDIEQQAFVITLVAVLDEPVLRPPAMREGRAANAGPVPIGPTVKRIGQVSDLDLVGGVAVEIGGDGQGPREQECRVYDGKLALPDAATGFDVQEMVEEPFVTGSVWLGTLRACEQIPQAPPRDLGGEASVENSALDDDGNRRQRHADGSDTDRSVRIGLVADQSIVRVGFAQIVKNRGQLQQTQLCLAGQLIKVVVGSGSVCHE